MHFHFHSRTGVVVAVVLAAALFAQEPPTAPRGPEPSKGVPPRATPADYQAHAQAGTVTIAAEFTGHGIVTLQGTLTTEEYVVVETGLFGSPGARTTLSAGDFSLRINVKKTPLSSQPYGLVVGN